MTHHLNPNCLKLNSQRVSDTLGKKLIDFGNAVRTLARKAFPQERSGTRDRIAKTQFLRGLDGDMQLKVRLAKPKTLEDAIKMAVKYEATVKKVGQNQF